MKANAITGLLPLAFAAALATAPVAHAGIDGVTGTTFSLVAKRDVISTGDGATVPMWGYSLGSARMQYPGPTLIVNEGDTVTINLNAQTGFPEAVSIVFPGLEGVTARGTGAHPTQCAGALTLEVDNRNCTRVTYSFVARRPGTYLYHSGTHQDLQVEMGLVGALVVRPRGWSTSNRTAYGHPDTAYDHEHLLLLTDVDAEIHNAVQDAVAARPSGTLAPVPVDMSKRFANYWFINGRNAPDTLQPAAVPWLPTQPYNALPRMHAGERVLMRMVNAGLDLHPFHHHGNHARVIARDGGLLESAAGHGPDLSESNFTVQSVPGQTADAIFEWTGLGLGWDVFGRKPEECVGSPDPDCGKPVPVVLPDNAQLTFGPHYSGSPFIGNLGTLPPGEGGMNLNGGLFFMWHSHNEKEMTNYNIFPGGMMTMMIVEPAGVEIP
ncbi:MAG TPA: multicopper oxidase domain-containing protein [Azospirillum sp.]|nr:multicopper oxidase domain-containing protein [Azospirillum sp.]